MKLKKNDNKKIPKNIVKFITLIIICLIIELILSNISNINLLFNKANNSKAEFKLKSNELTINTNDIQIQNVKIYYSKQDYTNIVKYNIILTSYGNELNPREFETIKTLQKNKKINIDSENITKDLNIKLTFTKSSADIEKVIINDTSIEFSFFRFIFILVLLTFISLLKKINKSTKWNSTNKSHKAIFYIYIILIISIFILLFKLFTLSFKENEKEISDYYKNYLNAQVEAIINKRISLLLEPTSELLYLKNPYDLSLRTETFEFLTDYSLYNNKFYSYFGVAPLIILLPFKLITGYYLKYNLLTILLFIIASLLLARFYELIINRYVKNISIFNFIIGFITLYISSNLICLLKPMVYEIEVLCGIIFLLLSLILIFSIYNNKKHVYLKIIFISISMGLLVLSKPSYIFYYILICYFLIELRKILDKKTIKRSLILFFIPITLIAIFQLWWNYVRFDSVLCFGNKYQLTILDGKNLTFLSPLKLLNGLLVYFFNPPELHFSEFPFIFLKPLIWLNQNFNTIMYNYLNIGIMVAPISWIFILYPTLKKYCNFSKKLKNFILAASISLLLILIITIRNGIDEIYVIDVKIWIYLIALIISFKLIEKNNNLIIQKIFWIICIASILVILPTGYLYSIDYPNEVDTIPKIILTNIFEFWH